MDQRLSFEIESGAISAVEEAAIAAWRHVGLGDEIITDEAARGAMYQVLSVMNIDGHILFGEGDEFETKYLFDGENLGQGGSKYDIALDALEGITLAAKAMQNALSVIAIAPKGGMMRVPEIYMDKIAIGQNYPANIIDLDASVAQNVKNVAQFKGVEPNRIGVCVLDRPRHAKLISDLREVGARVYLISDGDVAGVIYTTEPDSNIDIYMGQGGAHEGVLSAAALKCVGGQFEGRLVIKSEDDKAKLRKIGIENFDTKYSLADLVKSDVVFAACGVTDGTIVGGVRQHNKNIETNTLFMNSQTKIKRLVRTLRLNLEQNG